MERAALRAAQDAEYQASLAADRAAAAAVEAAKARRADALAALAQLDTNEAPKDEAVRIALRHRRGRAVRVWASSTPVARLFDWAVAEAGAAAASVRGSLVLIVADGPLTRLTEAAHAEASLADVGLASGSFVVDVER